MLKPPLAISGTLYLFLSEGGGLSVRLCLVTLCFRRKGTFSIRPYCGITARRGGGAAVLGAGVTQPCAAWVGLRLAGEQLRTWLKCVGAAGCGVNHTLVSIGAESWCVESTQLLKIILVSSISSDTLA